MRRYVQSPLVRIQVDLCLDSLLHAAFIYEFLKVFWVLQSQNG